MEKLEEKKTEQLCRSFDDNISEHEEVERSREYEFEELKNSNKKDDSNEELGFRARAVAAEKIYSNAHVLHEIFEKAEKERPGFISKEIWEKEISKYVPNFEILPSNNKKKEKKYINYSEYLAKFYLRFNDKDKNKIYLSYIPNSTPAPPGSLENWREDVIKAIVASIVSKGQTLVSAFKEYNTSKKGLLSFTEFWEAMKKCNEVKDKITKRLCYDLMQSIDKNKDGKIDYLEFRDVFKPLFIKFTEASDNILNAVTALTREFILKHGSIQEAFLKFDRNQDQKITSKEFERKIKKDIALDKKTRKTIFAYVSNSKDQISEKDFLRAFDSGNKNRLPIRIMSSAKILLVYHLCETVRSNKDEFYNIWRNTEKKGQISETEFENAFVAMNEQLKKWKKEDPVMNAAVSNVDSTNPNPICKKLYTSLEISKNGLGFLEMFECGWEQESADTRFSN